MNTDDYFKDLENNVKKVYVIAEEARKKGFDPVNQVEVPLATSLAEKAIRLIALIYPQLDDKKIIDRVLELEKQYGQLDVAVSFKIAEEIAKEKFCKFRNLLEAIDAGIRVGFAYTTLGVVSSPIEGYTGLKLGKTKEGKDYFIASFSGPIRSAGTTAGCVVLMIIDYLRELFGFAKYDPNEREVKRYVTENYDYHERVTNLQYLPTEEEIIFLAKNLPIQIDGEPSEKREVSNYKDLPRVSTNLIRGGMCLIFSEGLAQKAQKGLRLYNGLKEKGFQASGWDFLEEYVTLHKKREKGSKDTSPTYIKDIVAGRPVFGYPSKSGGFRFRYGKSRTSGFSAVSVSPATMVIAGSFLSVGTQLKVEKPTKGAAVTSCDRLDGPIVKLKNGSVKKIDDFEEAKRLYDDVEEIIYLGDILFSLGDVINRNYELIKPGYVEEWWVLELKKKSEGKVLVDPYNINFEQAIKFSEKYKINLHPKYIFYWTQISFDDLLALLDWLGHGNCIEKIILPFNKTDQERFKKGKRTLEILGVEHEVTTENVVLSPETSKTLLANLGISSEGKSFADSVEEICKKIKENGEKSVLEIINLVAKYTIKDKAGTFIGARMGRPEKAKLRKLVGSPNVLFPIGEEGGRFRSVSEAAETGQVFSSFPLYFCDKCNKETIYRSCEACGSGCSKRYYCPECKNKSLSEKCGVQNHVCNDFMARKVNIKPYYDSAIKKLQLLPNEVPNLIKGVRGTSSAGHDIENLTKGFLRSIFSLTVNKDGTIRYDATELPITHFKPLEVMTSVEKLKEFGYDKDIHGKGLESEDQILELKPHDIILPSCPESPDERADEVFIRIANFLDTLLLNLYDLKPFYKIQSKEDLIGQICVCMAPHNCAGVISRIIGFSRTQSLLASPYMHAAMRRDCVHPSTKLFFYDEETKEIFYENVGEYVEKLIKEGAKTKKVDGFGTLAVENKKNIYAMGINPETHELKKKKIRYFIKGPKTKEWVKVTTATNREYVMTPTHKFMHIENGMFKFKNAKEAKEGDKLPVLEKFNFNSGHDSINLLGLFMKKLPDDKKKEIIVEAEGKEVKLSEIKELNFSSGNLRWKFSKHKIPIMLKIDSGLMRILGYYAAEGYGRTNKWVSQVGFRICNPEMQDYLISLIEKVFGIKPNKCENNSKITICSKLIYYFFKCIETGDGAYEKRVPKFIFGLDNNLVKEYISAYFEGDGSIIKSKAVAAFYSVSRSLLDDISLLLAKFGILGRYFRTGLRLPGRKVLERYKELGKKPKMHILNHLVLGRHDAFLLGKILNLVNKRKAECVKYLQPSEVRHIHYNHKQILLNAQSDYVEDYVKNVEVIKDEKNSYCVEIEWNKPEERNVLWGEQIINTRCDGDEAAIMLLLDVLLNFSRKFLPSHRGGTQDAPLVLNARIRAGEVDDQILDLEMGEYLLELYELAEQGKHSSEIKIENVKKRLKDGKDPFTNLVFTHDCSDFNKGIVNSSYKYLPTMKDKVGKQMEVADKLRSLNPTDVAKLVIDRHFIRDIRGNLRKFSQQEFRCSKCNEKYRRPPLVGKCIKCGGNIIFTISEGSIIKYLEPALQLAEKYNIPEYLKQSLELTKSYIESIFGRDSEKQADLKKWF